MKQLGVETVATALLVAIVIGSGVMGVSLARGNLAVALLANTFATVAGLYVLIEVLRAHMNPVVSLVLAMRGELPWRELPARIAAQCLGAVAGACLAHAMFGLSLLQLARTPRATPGLWLSETVATAGLVFVVLRGAPERVALLVAAWIGAAYWFTASTSFANPAVTLGRMLSDTFAGIAPASVPMFIAMQIAGALLGLACARGVEGTPQRP